MELLRKGNKPGGICAIFHVLHLSCILQYMDAPDVPAKKRKTKTAVLTIRLDPSIKAAAEIAAEQEHRSVTGFIEVLILNHCRAAGIELPMLKSGRGLYEQSS
ncbi:MAG: hypothetical protein WB424_08895 [Terracidiphilus sp.]